MRLRLLSPILFVLLLTACQNSTTVSYTMTMNTEDPVLQEELARAAERMIARRLDAMGQDVRSGDVTVEGQTVTVRAENTDLAEALAGQITLPFALRIMVESTDGSPDIQTENFGGFDETGIGEEQIEKVTAGAVSGGGASAVILFTQEGGQQLKTLFEENQGKKMGIFLRGVLMSQKVLNASDIQTSISVDGIPNLELASTFADDVNVGAHVTFTKKQ